MAGSYCKFLSSSVGKKLILAFTGTALSLFLLMHVAGNLVVLVNRAKFNDYAHNLESMGLLLYAAEIGLIAIFAIHLAVAIKLTIRNKGARPDAYYLKLNTGRSRRTWGSSNMILSGLAILVFVIYHLFHFKFADHEPVTQNGVVIRDLALTVIKEFKELDEVIIYCVALLILGLHLRHGFRSIFETLGVSNSKFDKAFQTLSTVYVFGVTGAFILIPLWIYFGVEL